MTTNLQILPKASIIKTARVTRDERFHRAGSDAGRAARLSRIDGPTKRRMDLIAGLTAVPAAPPASVATSS